MTTKFLDNKMFTFKILLSWRFPRKIAFWTISLPAPLPTHPPLKSANVLFLLSSRFLWMSKVVFKGLPIQEDKAASFCRKWVVAKLQADKSASQSSMELFESSGCVCVCAYVYMLAWLPLQSLAVKKSTPNMTGRTFHRTMEMIPRPPLVV